jgi:hypothetical protein
MLLRSKNYNIKKGQLLNDKSMQDMYMTIKSSPFSDCEFLVTILFTSFFFSLDCFDSPYNVTTRVDDVAKLSLHI